MLGCKVIWGVPVTFGLALLLSSCQGAQQANPGAPLGPGEVRMEVIDYGRYINSPTVPVEGVFGGNIIQRIKLGDQETLVIPRAEIKQRQKADNTVRFSFHVNKSKILALDTANRNEVKIEVFSVWPVQIGRGQILGMSESLSEIGGAATVCRSILKIHPPPPPATTLEVWQAQGYLIGCKPLELYIKTQNLKIPASYSFRATPLIGAKMTTWQAKVPLILGTNHIEVIGSHPQGKLPVRQRITVVRQKK